jgi:hypothetical protein
MFPAVVSERFLCFRPEGLRILVNVSSVAARSTAEAAAAILPSA